MIWPKYFNNNKKLKGSFVKKKKKFSNLLYFWSSFCIFFCVMKLSIRDLCLYYNELPFCWLLLVLLFLLSSDLRWNFSFEIFQSSNIKFQCFSTLKILNQKNEIYRKRKFLRVQDKFSSSQRFLLFEWMMNKKKKNSLECELSKE